jgi:quercetin dioxygenase-like cupin family protein
MDRGLVVIEPSEAESLNVGARTLLMGSQSLTGGSYNLLDQEIPPGLLAAVHAHTHEDQAVFVLSGVLTIWVDGTERDVRPGSYAMRPAGIPHAMWNAGDTAVRMIEITSPAAGFEAYMRRISDLNSSGASSPEAIAKLAAEAGITFMPEATAEIAERTGTSASGGFWK